MADLPDYMTNPNAVLQDQNVDWLHGAAPDYNVVNTVYENEKTISHEEGSLGYLVSNIVKNWEKEASHKIIHSQWRTICQEKFRFSTNGGRWYTAEEIVQQGTYNALIGESEYYSASRIPTSLESHELFRNTFASGFAWECVEVYSPPPTVAFKWRHWGKMSGSLQKCPMRNGTLFECPATGENVEIFGVTVARLNDNYQITELETYFCPDDMFKQMSKHSFRENINA